MLPQISIQPFIVMEMYSLNEEQDHRANFQNSTTSGYCVFIYFYFFSSSRLLTEVAKPVDLEQPCTDFKRNCSQITSVTL